LKNGSFETPPLEAGETKDNPDGWEIYASTGIGERFGLTTEKKKEGRQTLRNKSLSRKSWKKKTMVVNAPNNAKVGNFILVVFDGYKPGSGGSFLVDATVVE